MWKVLAVTLLVLCTPSTAKDDDVVPSTVKDDDILAPTLASPKLQGTEVPNEIEEQIFKKIFPAMPKVPLIPKKYWPVIKLVIHMEVDYKYFYDPETKTTTYTTKKQFEDLSSIPFANFAKPTWGTVLMNAAQRVGFILLMAYLYKTMVVDKRKPFPENVNQSGEFRFGLCDCFGNMNLCCLAFCCAPMRAADTFNSIGAMPYWNVIAIFAVVWAVATILPALATDDYEGWAYLVLAVCFFRYRNELRKKLGKKEDADMSSQVTDFVAWCCCQCCVIAQEARVVDATSGEEPACPFCSGLKSSGEQGAPLVGNPVAAE